MAARLYADFRSGNLAEHLGLLPLKGIAAIADVPRTEDVGLDAVASLLRRDDGSFYAEDGFVVQLKAESVESISYTDHELKWLLGHSLPMFIDRVSLTRSAQRGVSSIVARFKSCGLHRPAQIIWRHISLKMPLVLGIFRRSAASKWPFPFGYIFLHFHDIRA